MSGWEAFPPRLELAALNGRRSGSRLPRICGLIHDLFFEISFNDSYDSKPAETARNNDWNLSTSLGYSF